jgi:L-aspartate oxidase
VIGAGVAGLRAAIELAKGGSVLVVAKDSLRESSSEYAQGGIAAALSDDDEVGLHEHDTINAGAGLCNRDAVRVLVEEGPNAIQELIEWGAEFDREGAKLLFAHEGAHSRRRVLHSHGDSTGREIARTLHRKAASLENVQFRSFSAITDLLANGSVINGAVACDREHRQQVMIHAGGVLLATGGLGKVYKETTNPDVATGDGVAAAYRAGALISDIEFVQFHPTALYVQGAPRFLLSEALRGEGAYLRNAAGERFMAKYHPMAELAPRDVVSRSIVEEMRVTGSHVFLDLTHRDAQFVRRRFPRIYETCLSHGVDITAAPAPVHPAAHYSMGGVATDLDGRVPDLEGLFAAGEVACTGVHGANRLASNSLLEGVVFGKRAGQVLRDSHRQTAGSGRPRDEVRYPVTTEDAIRSAAWDYCGVIRSGEGLRRAIQTLEGIEFSRTSRAARSEFELRNMHLVALLIAKCALAREESRGAHYRTDFPATKPEFQRHSYVRLGIAAHFGA